MRAVPLFSLAVALCGMALVGNAQVPQVVADTPIAQSLTAQVMGDLATPSLLLAQGSDPHHAQLRPSQARALSRADLVIWTSADLSPWLAEVLGTLAPETVMELAAVAGTHHQPFQENALVRHDHDHVGRDPHLWLNPENARLWLGAIAAQLAVMDPDNAATYAENASAAQAQISVLSQDIAALLTPAQGVGLVMHHDAYGYFADAFDLTVLGSIASGDAVDPGAARIAALRAALAEVGAVCLFPEVNHADAYVALVAEGQGLRMGAPLDPAGVMLEPGPGLYAEVLRGLAQAIADCAQGD
ncbi:zinc ABC transporter substrate-binding protein [Pararhodobacter sp.]|uniref:zinc ABC transporter substrate-binding protein n=1 Tax=Pararhodobacter sp. TaxID=2127056 RepID=UPI002AFF3A5E|nr:zinc ABC transporter substrate-binding protein [Pararhodobacter sp.]